jgi:hypothetical protein
VKRIFDYDGSQDGATADMHDDGHNPWLTLRREGHIIALGKFETWQIFLALFEFYKARRLRIIMEAGK